MLVTVVVVYRAVWVEDSGKRALAMFHHPAGEASGDFVDHVDVIDVVVDVEKKVACI